MTKELEQRLAALEQELAAAKQAHHSPSRQLKPTQRETSRVKIRKILVIFLILLSLVGVATFGYHTVVSRNDFPVAITKNLPYVSYYPAPLPPGYYYKKDSASTQGDIVFYTLVKRDSSAAITVNIVAKPSNAMDLALLDGFKEYKTINGPAYIGKQKDSEAAIVVTDSSLVTISGSSEVGTDILGYVAQNLRPVAKQ